MRHITPKMVKFLDAKLAGNGLAHEAIKNKDARLVYRLAIEACVGIKEKTGHNDGEMVEEIQKTIGGAGREPWCMGLQQTGLAYAELKCGVVSPIPPSELCSYVWNHTPVEQRVERIPAPGALAIWADLDEHGNVLSTGHTEMVTAYYVKGESFSAVGGNTSGTTTPGGEVNRDGNACVYTSRSIHPTKKRKLLGFLKPF